MLPRRIGFLGLGIMGSAMARNIMKAGYDLKVWNRDRKKTEDFAKSGVYAAPTPKILAAQCNTLITMVTDDAAMKDITENPDGIFAAGSPGLTLINMSTNSVRYTGELAGKCFQKGIRFIACPVSGSKPLAENGTLVILAGGKKEDIDKNEKILLTMGKSIVRAGPPEKAAALKLAVNLIVAHLTSAICESSLLAESMGLDKKLIFRVLRESPALNCPYFFLKEKNMLENDFTPAFPLKHMLKDLRFMLEEAEASGQGLPVTESLKKTMEKGETAGDGDFDLSVLKQTIKNFFGGRQ